MFAEFYSYENELRHEGRKEGREEEKVSMVCNRCKVLSKFKH